MKSSQSIIDFTQHSWFANVKRVQHLRSDVTILCLSLGINHAEQCELFFNEQQLTIKTNAALATRLRQIEPDLLAGLLTKGWVITAIKLVVVKHADALHAQLKQTPWVNPNLARYGKRTTPSDTQRAILLTFLRSKPRTQPIQQATTQT